MTENDKHSSLPDESPCHWLQSNLAQMVSTTNKVNLMFNSIKMAKATN